MKISSVHTQIPAVIVTHGMQRICWSEREFKQNEFSIKFELRVIQKKWVPELHYCMAIQLCYTGSSEDVRQ